MQPDKKPNTQPSLAPSQETQVYSLPPQIPAPVQEPPKKSHLVSIVIALVLLIIICTGTFLKLHARQMSPTTSTTTSDTANTTKTLDSLQSNQQDTALKNEASRVLVALDDYAANNSGTYPNDAATLQSAVQQAELTNTGMAIQYESDYISSVSPLHGVFFYYHGYTCTGDKPLTSSMRSIALTYVLQNGSYICQSN